MRKATLSLAAYVSIWTAVAIAVSMGIYGVFEYFVMPGATVEHLLLEHSWHVLVLGAVTYVVCWVVLRVAVVRPLQDIFFCLYRIGAGELKPIEMDTHISEVRGVIEGVNAMIWRMGGRVDHEAINGVQEKLKQLGQAAQELRVAAEKLSALERSVSAALQRAVEEKAPR
jgi:nitrate/nitrite-specific signal transduction histidine kinase